MAIKRSSGDQEKKYDFKVRLEPIERQRLEEIIKEEGYKSVSEAIRGVIRIWWELKYSYLIDFKSSKKNTPASKGREQEVGKE